MILDAKDFVVMRMCGAVATDETSAASGALRSWEAAVVGSLISAMGVDGAKLPREEVPRCGGSDEQSLREPSGDAKSPVGGDCAWPGDLEGIPVVIGAGDSLATAFLFAAPDDDGSDRPMLEISGTSTCLMRQTAEPAVDPAGRLMCFPAADGHSYCIEAAIHTTGACLDWISRTLDMELNDGLDWSKVESVPAGADGLVFLPYIGPGERSRSGMICSRRVHWDHYRAFARAWSGGHGGRGFAGDRTRRHRGTERPVRHHESVGGPAPTVYGNR